MADTPPLGERQGWGKQQDWTFDGFMGTVPPFTHKTDTKAKSDYLRKKAEKKEEDWEGYKLKMIAQENEHVYDREREGETESQRRYEWIFLKVLLHNQWAPLSSTKKIFVKSFKKFLPPDSESRWCFAL